MATMGKVEVADLNIEDITVWILKISYAMSEWANEKLSIFGWVLGSSVDEWVVKHRFD